MDNDIIIKSKKWWQNKTLRMIQTCLRETDMLDIKADSYVDELKKFKADVVMINTSGIIASYDTKLPYHFQSPYLKGDSLKDIVAACHNANIKVIGRMDFTKVRKQIYDKNPEWAYISPKGKTINCNGDTHVCFNSKYQQEYAFEIIKETIRELDIDGIYLNMGGYMSGMDYANGWQGICQCEGCRQRFMEMYGMELPKNPDNKDEAYQKYALFQERTLREYHSRMMDSIVAVKPDIFIDKQNFMRIEANTSFNEMMPNWQYNASALAKTAVGSGMADVIDIASVDFIDTPYRHVAVSPYQQELRLSQSLANGGSIDYFVIGRLDTHADKSGHEPVKRIYQYHAQNEEEYRDLVSTADIALIQINAPLQLLRKKSEYRGWYNFLVENHFVFDSLIVKSTESLQLNKYKVIILPDIKYISEEFATQIDTFVKEGGTVISVGSTGLYDRSEELLDKPIIKSLGIKKIDRICSDMRSSYIKIADRDKYPRLTNTELVYVRGSYIYVDYEKDVEMHLNLIEPHMYAPPERAYYKTVSDYPGFTVNAYGKGRGVYIPWEPGKEFSENGFLNLTNFIADFLETELEIKPIGGELSPMVEVTVMEKKDQSAIYVHLINSSGYTGNSYFAPITMHDIEIEVPYGGFPESVTSLVTGKNCSYEVNNGYVTVKIGQLGLFEAIKIVPESAS
jgi:hypothetical protein